MRRPVDLTQLLNLRSDGRPILQLLGEAGFFWLYMGELDNARGVFNALARLAPDDPAAEIGLAQVALANDNPQAAEQHAQQALLKPLAQRSGSALALVLLAEAQDRVGRHESAQRHLRRAIDLDTGGPAAAAARFHLQAAQSLDLAGEAEKQWSKRNYLESMRLWENALAACPDGPIASMIQQRLSATHAQVET